MKFYIERIVQKREQFSVEAENEYQAHTIVASGLVPDKVVDLSRNLRISTLRPFTSFRETTPTKP